MPNFFQEKLLLYKIRANRDSDAFGRIYDTYVKRIFRFVYFKVRSQEEAQDITSETFLKLWQYLSGGKRVDHLGALIYQIARNSVIDHNRQAGRSESLSSDESMLQIPDIAGLSNIHRSAEISQVLTAVKLLKDEYREIITMRYIDGIEPSEIAALLGKKPGHVRVLLHRALETVRALLASNDSGRT